MSSNLHLQKSTIKTYLFGVGKNKLFKRLKEHKRVLRAAETPESNDYTEIKLETTVPTSRQLKLVKMLDDISGTCKELLQLFYYRNLTIDEIVELTHYKDGNTVRSHKSRCLKTLKSRFNVK